MKSDRAYLGIIETGICMIDVKRNSKAKAHRHVAEALDKFYPFHTELSWSYIWGQLLVNQL